MSGETFDILHADPWLALLPPSFQGELLELAQQPLLALTDLRDERLGRLSVERQSDTGCLCAHPLRQLPGLDVHLRDLSARPPA